jgi:hypothetical protein
MEPSPPGKRFGCGGACRLFPPATPDGLQERERKMTKSAIGIAALLLWSLPTVAQAQAPAPTETVTTPRLNLTLEQRHVIKEVIKDMKVAPAATSVREIGDAIPQDAAAQPMPNDIGRKVPQVKTHRFLLTAERILIVDPKDNKVAEVIELN